MWRCGGSTLHPYLVSIYPRININLHYPSAYVQIFTFEMWNSTLLHKTSIQRWRCGGTTLHPHFRCGDQHFLRIYSKMNVNLHCDDAQYTHVSACIHIENLEIHIDPQTILIQNVEMW